jgi:uncharacterized membrane protein YuzA (DUF378 family)
VKKLDVLTSVLLVIGGLNWGLVSIARFDLVAAGFGLDFGQTTVASRIVYGLVGLSALYQAVQLLARRRRSSARRHAMAAASGRRSSAARR